MNLRIAFLSLSVVATLAKAESAAVEAFASSAVLGMKLSAQQRAQQGKLSDSEFECVKAIPSSELYPAVEEVIGAALTPSERVEVDRFFGTKVGQKYTKHGLLQLYSAVGMQVPEALPNFSDTEYRELEQFATTTAGKKLINGKVMQSASAKQEYGNRIRDLLKRCKAT